MTHDAQKLVVYTPRNFGGVREVSEQIAAGFAAKKYTVALAHSSIDLIKLRLMGYRHAILALHVGIAACLFRRSIYVLHGFPQRSVHSIARFILQLAAARLASLGGASLVAVSQTVETVWSVIFGQRVVQVILNGVSGEFFDGHAVDKEKTALFAGRLSKAKRVEECIEGFLASGLPNLGYAIEVIGEGPLWEDLAERYSEQPQVRILGKLSKKDRVSAFQRAEYFISGNPFEPMGLVFAEALVSGCKIISPNIGGHREFIPENWPSAHFKTATTSQIAEAFDKLLNTNGHQEIQACSEWGYEQRVVPQYEKILFHNTLTKSN